MPKNLLDVEKQNAFRENQFGLRNGRSTETAIIKLAEEIYKCINDNNKRIVVF